MENIISLAEHFEVLVKKAAGMTAKEINQALKKARKDHADCKGRYESAKSQLDALNKEMNDANDKMNQARKDVLKHHDILLNMDLAAADCVRFHGDEVAYCKDGKQFRVETDEKGERVVKPFNIRKTVSKDPKGEETTSIEVSIEGDADKENVEDDFDLLQNLK